MKFNAAFWKWFGDSKVVDEHGRPLVVWHGSPNKFNTFKMSEDIGIHFGTLEQATDRLVARAKRSGLKKIEQMSGEDMIAQGFLRPFFLSVQKPIELSDLQGCFTDADELADLIDSWKYYYEADFKPFLEGGKTTKELREYLLSHGIDGIFYRNDVEGPGISWAVFRPEQIKSIDNDGTWDADDPDIQSNPPMTRFEQRAIELKKGMLELDIALTGKEKEARSQAHHKLASQDEILDFVSGGREYYLSDGGYSRVVFGESRKKLFLTSNSLQTPKSNWLATQALREQIERVIAEFRDELLLDDPDIRSNPSSSWSKEEADAFLTGFAPVMEAAGFRAEIVGSVKKRGGSDKDLDILLRPTKQTTVSDGIAVLEKYVAPLSDKDAPPDVIETIYGWAFVMSFSGKTVEFFFPPDMPVEDDSDIRSNPMKTLYHVTFKKNADKIIKKGILPFQPSLWVKSGTGERYGEGEIFAFDALPDAMRWAAAMDWEFHKQMGSGKIAIVMFTDDRPWEIDESDPLRQAGRKGNWLKRHGSVPAESIRSVMPLTAEMAKRVAQSW